MCNPIIRQSKGRTTGVALAVALFGPVPAETADLSGYLAAATDYVWRGVTQSDSKPSAQLGLDINHDSGFYAGIWAATIDISNGPTRQRDTQVNYYVGYSGSISRDWNLGGYVVAYRYPGADSDVDYYYTEYTLTASYDDRIWFDLSVSNDLYGSGNKTRNLEIYFERVLAANWTLGGGAGYYDVSDLVNTGYGYWQLGISRPVGFLDLDLRYHDTNRSVPVVSSPERSDSRIVFSARWSF